MYTNNQTALLRPGRFEVQIEVPPPRTNEQRVSILKVHTKSMNRAGRLLINDPPSGTAASRYIQVRSGMKGKEIEGFSLVTLSCTVQFSFFCNIDDLIIFVFSVTPPPPTNRNMDPMV